MHKLKARLQDESKSTLMAKKILIIDDEHDICEVLAEYLRESGYDARYECDGKKGLELIGQFRPNLLILDIRMPGMDGFEVLKGIVRQFPSLIVIVYTGVDQQETKDKALRYGACEYVTKPTSPQKLREDYILPILGE
ncbi:MAG: response regulator [Candidatus Omnitrophica bacterium]|nr:response regulator [Candidatus Omnitrophota bacterium]